MAKWQLDHFSKNGKNILFLEEYMHNYKVVIKCISKKRETFTF